MFGWLTLVALTTVMSVSEPEPCRSVDEAMLALPLEDFDQSDTGWRSLEKPGCEVVVADGIKLYREQNAAALERDDGLIWHEAQLRASAGQSEQAVALMLRSRETDGPAVRPYTDATIAFLRHDKPALLAARKALVTMPEPEYFKKAADQFKASYPDVPALTWPLNLDVVDGLINCFDQPYAEAYDCR